MRIRRTCIVLFLLPTFFLFPAAPSRLRNTSTPYRKPREMAGRPGLWPVSAWMRVFFEHLVNNIQNGVSSEVHAVLVARNNRLVFENYWSGYDFAPNSRDYHGMTRNFTRDTRHNTHSATKSIASALVGIGLDRGLIRSKDDTVFDYLPDHYDAWKNQGRENITIAHYLMTASGLEWNERETGVTASDNDMMRFNISEDPVAHLLSKPLRTPPGSSFYYDGGTVDLLGVLLANAAS